MAPKLNGIPHQIRLHFLPGQKGAIAMPIETDNSLPNGSPVVVTAPVIVNGNEPGQGGFLPPAWMPPAMGILASVLTAVGEAMSLPDHSLPVLIGAAIKALVVGIAAWLGLKSAGPRKDV
jgi:hypothetical protein